MLKQINKATVLEKALSTAMHQVKRLGVFLTYTLTDHGGRSKVKLLISLQSNFDLGYSNQWTKNRAKELEMKVCIPN
jgi:hypothetical protein